MSFFLYRITRFPDDILPPKVIAHVVSEDDSGVHSYLKAAVFDKIDESKWDPAQPVDVASADQDELEEDILRAKKYGLRLTPWDDSDDDAPGYTVSGSLSGIVKLRRNERLAAKVVRGEEPYYGWWDFEEITPEEASVLIRLKMAEYEPSARLQILGLASFSIGGDL